MIPRPLRSTLFPYTTLFRSEHAPGHMLTLRKLSGRPAVLVFWKSGSQPSIDAVRDLQSRDAGAPRADRKSTRLNSSHLVISYAVFCLKKKTKNEPIKRSSSN